MKWIASILLMLGLATTSFGQPQKKLMPDRPNITAAQKRGAAPGMMVLIEGLYVNALRQQGQQQAELTDDQINKIVPLLRQYLRDRNQVDGVRRPRARNRLQQAINNRVPDEELAPLIQEFDQVNADAQAAQEKFLAAADPVLTTRQRAWLRLFQIRMEERISNFIQEGRKP
jgi:Spy/CpxP family protein refolding chaperone